MRIVLVALLLAAAPPPSSRVLECDIALSEFTVPPRLTLDLDTGRYDAVPPDRTWSPPYPQPQPRHGTLTDERRAVVRAASDAAFRAGLSKAGCDRGPLALRSLIITNAPVPMMRIGYGRRAVVAPDDWSCFTPQALALHRLVDDL